MSQNLSLKLKLEKLGFKEWTHKGTTYMLAPKSMFYAGEKWTYLDLVAFLNDAQDQYGNHGTIAISKKKEDKDKPNIYVGDIKRMSGAPTMTADAAYDLPPEPAAADTSEGAADDDFDDLPF